MLHAYFQRFDVTDAIENFLGTKQGHSQVRSYFEDFDVRNTLVQSKFNLHVHSGIYGFFCFKLVCMWVM